MKRPYVSFTGATRPFVSLKLWRTLAIISWLVTISITAVFIWYATTYKTGQELKLPEDAKDVIVACPQLPTLVDLPKPPPEQITQVFVNISSILRSMVDKDASLPAISMNVFYKNETLWSGHFGSKVYKQSKTPDNNTVYRIGSVTKIFTVLLVYKLYEEGKISSLDDPLSRYAPEFDIMNPFTNENITLREIASQMSGLPREAPCMYTCNTNSSEQLALLRNRTLVLPPWVRPSYSNLGYGLLGRLLTENLLNQTFEDWTTENILRPLGMINSGFEITDEVEKNMAFPYLPGGKRMPFMNIGWLAPSGQMFSTIDDMTKLGMMLAQPSKQKLFKPSTLREMMSPRDITPDGSTVWGSPFEMAFKQHVLVRGKAGFIDSYQTSFSVIPELALGATIFISANSYIQQSNSAASSTMLYDLLVPRLNKTLFAVHKRSPFPISPFPFIGKYLVQQTDPFKNATITYTASIKRYQNILRLECPKPALDFEIKYIGESYVFQASKRTPGMTCFQERMGILAGMYFGVPGPDHRSHGFEIPEWLMTAKRVQED